MRTITINWKTMTGEEKAAYQSAYRRTNLVRLRKYDNERNWVRDGILNSDGSRFTTTDFDRAYQIQGGSCKICNKHQSELRHTLAADHDHATGLFRGLLCPGCNTKLHAIEDTVWNMAALNYLKGDK